MFIDINEMRFETRDILQCVLFTKNTSLFCSLLQSINLSVFVITNNVNILYYLPILWSISAFVLSLNFVRNYKFLQKHLFVFKRCCQCICYRKVKTNTNTITNPSQHTKRPHTNAKAPNGAHKQHKPIQIMVHNEDDKYHAFDELQLHKIPHLTLDISNINKHSQSLDLYETNDQPPPLLRAQSDPLAALGQTPTADTKETKDATTALLTDMDTMRIHDEIP
eukprot:153634_1